ncbi:thioesterase domain-containing protein [Streptomyces europaeiscabiei]|uniref:thioesterase II family protein n=1 Tax=Streptomyces europaeiscabiei TaxID=146819 RepID=UPI0029AC3BBA|nr:thioesterase domain-containing protein [Streptomyces europaeiscabiei]MDX3696404.1 thioesterase domain-containing protein [Streptomyces europaeiscabiei]
MTNPGARARLLCFPCAGAGTMMYRPWQRLLPDDLELCLVQPPGREDRAGEPPLTRATEVVDGLLPEVCELLDLPMLFFGHSMGALLAHTLTLRLREEGRGGPRHLFVSGRPAPQVGHRGPVRHQLSDPGLTKVLRELGGMPEEAFAVPELMEWMLPLVRADFAVSETHRPAAPGPPLDLPVTALGGLNDPLVPTDDLYAWRESTNDPFAAYLFEGGHFYLHDAAEQVVRIILAEHESIGALATGRPGMSTGCPSETTAAPNRTGIGSAP